MLLSATVVCEQVMLTHVVAYST